MNGNMGYRSKKDNLVKWIVIGLFLIIISCMVIPAHMVVSDDTVFHEQLNSTPLFQWLENRYYTWSGRMSIELVLGMINYNMPLWKLLNIIVAGIFFYGVCRYVTDEGGYKVQGECQMFMACLFFCIYPTVLVSSIVWVTGSFYYLWATTAFIYALYPFYRAVCSKETLKINIMTFVAAAYACYMEQQLAILLCFGGFTILYLLLTKCKIKKSLVLYYLFCIINIGVYFSAPGTAIRSSVELKWYPGYENFSFLEKLYQGMNWTMGHFIESSNVLFLVFTGLICFLIYKKYRKFPVIYSMAGIPFLYMILDVIPFNGFFYRILNYQNATSPSFPQMSEVMGPGVDIEGTLKRIFFDVNRANIDVFEGGMLNLIPNIISFVVFVLAGIILIYCFNDIRKGIFAVVIYFAALVSGTIMGFSPTIFASRTRAFFVPCVLIWLLSGLVFEEIMQIPGVIMTKSFRSIKYAFVLFTGILILVLLVKFCSGTVYL